MAHEFINIHTHRRTEDALCLVSYGLGRDHFPAGPGEPVSAGIHPWDAEKVTGADLKKYTDFLLTAPLAAIGEIGLDYSRPVDRETQIKIFHAQLAVARERSLPVVIHCVRAHNDLFTAISSYPELDFILHGYVGSPELTLRGLDLGCSFLIGERSLDSGKTLRSLEIIPDGHIFAETDQSPLPIGDIYRRLAQAKNMTVEELAEIISGNYKKLFGSK